MQKLCDILKIEGGGRVMKPILMTTPEKNRLGSLKEVPQKIVWPDDHKEDALLEAMRKLELKQECQKKAK